MDEDVKKIRIEDYDYPLPDDRIARYPVSERHNARLLIAGASEFRNDLFYNLADYIPENSLLIFNETRVIQARLNFTTPKGSKVEVFCLEPVETDIQTAMSSRKYIKYRCLIGGARRWKRGILSRTLKNNIELRVEKGISESGTFVVHFQWNNENISFSEILELAGQTPLPPYLKRQAIEMDRERYQSIFARNSGSVAAPTASLHFTGSVIKNLEKKGIQFEKLNLHVGAGTFKPVVSDTIGEHSMHAEEFSISRKLLSALLKSQNRRIIPVGTTTMRALESLYFLGKMARDGVLNKDTVPFVGQWIPYEEKHTADTAENLRALLNYLDQNQLEEIRARTAIMITPNFAHRISDGLITNFHQPRSTLLLLVASLLGDRWRDMYNYALANDFRFLSYGDSCLILH